MQIINHFIIKGMKMDRSLNPSLNNYKMIEKGNVLRYISKDIDEEEQFFQTESNLNILLELKKYY
jgi:hypothetical protein